MKKIQLGVSCIVGTKILNGQGEGHIEDPGRDRHRECHTKAVVHKTESWLRLSRESQWAADANANENG